MKKITLTLLSVVAFFLVVNAQELASLSASEIKTVDLTGKYVGKRHQFAEDRKTIMQSFEYEFNLVQNGNIITGTSTIIKADGDYADIKLRGVVMGDKLYFEEYEVVNQDKNPNYVWCFKKGSLNIKREGTNLRLVGNTDSYIPVYYIPCTGGITNLTKADNNNSFKMDDASALVTIASVNMNVSPNPFAEATKISYTLPSSTNVTLEVFDITGKKISVLESNLAKNAGTYTVDFSATGNNLPAGIYIAKLTANGSVYSNEMVLMK